MTADRRESNHSAGRDSHSPDPTRVVADADVLAADVLTGGHSRDALDHLRRHSWLDLVATEPLLDDAAAVVDALATTELAENWQRNVSACAVVVDQPENDHPALAAAYQGGAAHLLSLDDRLRSADAGVNLRQHLDVSVRSPEAFAAVFDPGAVYELMFDDAYPGPDRDPRN